MELACALRKCLVVHDDGVVGAILRAQVGSPRIDIAARLAEA